jgi:choline dehydrogenase-like flavoprotein
MTADASPDAARPTDEIVDVLIIGAGASGAAVAWSLAETRMKILCLEQGDWIKSSEFPNGRDWEARRYTDFDISPNRRARDTDYPINDDDSPMKIANFNGVGGGTVLFTAHYPRMARQSSFSFMFRFSPSPASKARCSRQWRSLSLSRWRAPLCYR